MPSSIFIAKEKKSMPGLNTSQDKLTLLLKANAGDFKKKPLLIYYSKYCRVSKNNAISTLAVHYTWNKKD